MLMRIRTTLKRSRILNPQEEIPLALRAAYLMLHRQSDAAFAPHGVTADQFVLMVRLSEGHKRSWQFGCLLIQAPSARCWFCWKSVAWFVETLTPQTAVLERRQ